MLTEEEHGTELGRIKDEAAEAAAGAPAQWAGAGAAAETRGSATRADAQGADAEPSEEVGSGTIPQPAVPASHVREQGSGAHAQGGDSTEGREEETAPDAVDIRVRLSGGREAVARVRPDKVDLSEYGTLAALPEDLRRLAGQLRELKVESTELEALPAWVGELSRLEVLRVGVKEPWREKCPIRELPASLGALTGLQTLNLRGCSGLHTPPPSVVAAGTSEVLQYLRDLAKGQAP